MKKSKNQGKNGKPTYIKTHNLKYKDATMQVKVKNVKHS